jgi:hypothetical protein
LEKESGAICPRCSERTLDTYYTDESDIKVGAHCNTCDLRGFYLSDKLVPLVAGR